MREQRGNRIAPLGIDTKWLGRVGDDPLGERVTREIRAEGVEVHGGRGSPRPDRPDAQGAPDGEFDVAVFYYRAGSAGSRLHRRSPPNWVEEVELLHVSGITALLSDTARDCILAAIGRARSTGVQVSFDVNYRSTLAPPDLAGPLLRKIAENADLVFGGIEELQLLYPDGDGRGRRTLARRGLPRSRAEEGADGAAVYRGDEVVEGPGFTVDVVDTVGAGDAFVAGYLSGLLQRLEPPERLRRQRLRRLVVYDARRLGIQSDIG